MQKRLLPLYSKISQFLSWTLFSKQASLAISDQLIISLSGFLLTVVLTRNTSVEVFGRYSFIFVLSIFSGVILASLVTAPAMVLFASLGRYDKHYRGFLVVASVIIGFFLAIIATTIYFIYAVRQQIFSETAFHSELMAIAFFFAISHVQETLRRAAFARAHPWSGLRLTVVRCVPPPIILFALSFSQQIRLIDIIIVVATANLLSVLIECLIDRPQMPKRRFLNVAALRHWYSSRWLLPSSIFNTGYEQLFTLAAGFMYGDNAVAAIRICHQLFGLLYAGLQTLENTLLRQFALIVHNKNYTNYFTLVNTITLICFFGVAICGVTIWWFGKELIWLIFRINYVDYTLLLAFWAFSVACGSARSILAMGFRALQNTKQILIADIYAFGVALITFYPALKWLGVVGSAVGMLIAHAVGLTILVILFQLKAFQLFRIPPYHK